MAILFIFLIQYSATPIRKLREYNKIVTCDTLFFINYYPIYNLPEIVPVVRNKAYKEALIDLAAEDSIQLSVNLVDSTVCLYIKGVKIHQSRIIHFKKDKFFENMTNDMYTKLFSRSLNINSHYATIVKEPIVVRQAPKDTLEAALNVWQPDTLIQNPAFLQLSVDYGINLIFEQDTNPSYLDKWIRFRFYSAIWIENISRAFKNFFLLGNQEYQPTITIEIPVTDLRAVFRALPTQASVAIQF